MRKLIMIALMVLGTVNAFAQGLEVINDDNSFHIDFVNEDGENFLLLYTQMAVYEGDTTGFASKPMDYEKYWVEGGFFQPTIEVPLYMPLNKDDVSSIQEGGVEYIRIGQKIFILTEKQLDNTIALSNKVF